MRWGWLCGCHMSCVCKELGGHWLLGDLPPAVPELDPRPLWGGVGQLRTSPVLAEAVCCNFSGTTQLSIMNNT